MDVPATNDLLKPATGEPGSQLSAALRLAGSGLAVFPCTPGGKNPLTRHGFKDATTEPTQLRRWWSRWPNANLAVPTGGRGVDVVDVDTRSHGAGFSVLERARRAQITDGWALIVRTPSGGLHFYYPALQERPQGSWSAGEAHIDFRGAGGYVLVPPSKIIQLDGRVGVYETIAVGRDVHPLDAEALKTFVRPSHEQSIVLPPSPSESPQDRGRRIAEWLAHRPEGSRNGSLFWAACRMVEQHVSEKEARDLLLESARKAGLPDAETAATIRSAYRGALSHSRPDRAAQELRL